MLNNSLTVPLLRCSPFSFATKWTTSSESESESVETWRHWRFRRCQLWRGKLRGNGTVHELFNTGHATWNISFNAQISWPPFFYHLACRLKYIIGVLPRAKSCMRSYLAASFPFSVLWKTLLLALLSTD